MAFLLAVPTSPKQARYAMQPHLANAGLEAVPQGNKKMQNYTSVYKMLPSSLADSEDVEQDLMCFLKHLQLKWPSEPTCAVLTAILLTLKQGVAAAVRLSPSEKHAQLIAVKQRLQQLKNCSSTDVFIPALPEAAATLMKTHPLVYAAAYGAQTPEMIQVDEMNFLQLVASIKLRKTRKFEETIAPPGGQQAACMQQLPPAMFGAMFSAKMNTMNAESNIGFRA